MTKIGFVHILPPQVSLETPVSAEAATDAVNHPAHYNKQSGHEVIDVIEAYELGFNLGNVVKYVLRAGRKANRLEDLKKAQWYINREVNAIEQAQQKTQKG